jgi:hypothetical protein
MELLYVINESVLSSKLVDVIHPWDSGFLQFFNEISQCLVCKLSNSFLKF